MIAQVHAGERIMPAADNSAMISALRSLGSLSSLQFALPDMRGLGLALPQRPSFSQGGSSPRSGNGGGGDAGGGPGGSPIQIIIQALDGASVHRVVTGAEFAKAMDVAVKRRQGRGWGASPA
jgi:hypothetical protein